MMEAPAYPPIQAALTALADAAWTFRDYEANHLAKSPPDDAKASRNRQMAERMEAAQKELEAFEMPFHGLSAAEAERLFMLAEEKAEAIQAACKVLRHGYASFNPDDPDAGDNRRQLQAEITDGRAVEMMMYEVADLPGPLSSSIGKAKIRKLQYAHHQPRSWLADAREGSGK